LEDSTPQTHLLVEHIPGLLSGKWKMITCALKVTNIYVWYREKKFRIYNSIYQLFIYLLTAIWLTPGGSSTVHIYTQTIHRTTQLTNLVGRLSGIWTQSRQTKINDELTA